MDLEGAIAKARLAVEKAFGLDAVVQVRPNYRSATTGGYVPEQELYNTMVEFDVYVPGPGQVAEEARKKREAEGRAAAESAAKAAAEAAAKAAKKPKADA